MQKYQFPRVFERTGRQRSESQSFNIVDFFGPSPTSDSCLLAFIWSKRIPFFEIEPSVKRDPPLEPESFHNDVPGYADFLQKAGEDKQKIEQVIEEFAEQWELRYKLLRWKDGVDLNFIVHSSDPSFLRASPADWASYRQQFGEAIDQMPTCRQTAYMRSVLQANDQGRPPALAFQTQPPKLVVTFEARILWLGAPDANGSRLRSKSEDVVVEITPADELDPFSGFVAFDLGNTNSTVACLESHAKDVEEVQYLDIDAWAQAAAKHKTPGNAGPGTSERVMPSAVRLERFEAASPPAEPELPAAANNPWSAILPETVEAPAASQAVPDAAWTAGHAAMFGNPEHPLILGAKRILVDPKQQVPLDTTIKGQPIQVPKTVPAELLFTSMIQGFQGNKLGRSNSVAVTYPTTYSDYEIRQTRLAVVRALERSQGNRYFQLTDAVVEEAVPAETMLDEATAAAFYFIYKDFIRGPGQMSAFQYVFPRGVNVLLYDCGGGTTDISLIHCLPTQDETIEPDENGHRPSRVYFYVLGRTGHQAFGGDAVTEKIFLVLKARLACELSAKNEFGVPNLTFPKEPKEFPKFLETHREAINRLVPTNWLKKAAAGSDPEVRLSLNSDEMLQRRDLTLKFWKWSEEIKYKWSAPPPAAQEATLKAEPAPTKTPGKTVGPTPDAKPDKSAPRPFEPTDKDLRINLSALSCRGVATKDPHFQTAFLKTCDQIAALKPYVDAWIHPEIDRTAKAANNLIDARLRRPTRAGWTPSPRDGSPICELPEDGTVHCCYLVGKASHYPTIRQLLREKLHVRGMRVENTQLDGSNTQPDGSPDQLQFDVLNLKTCVAAGAALNLLCQQTLPDLKIRLDKNLSRRLPFTILYDGPKVFEKLFRENELYDDLTPRTIPVDPEATGTTVWLDRQWPGEEIERTDKGRELSQRYLEFKFDVPPEGPLTVDYVENPTTLRREFRMTDVNGREAFGTPVLERESVAPPQRGDL